MKTKLSIPAGLKERWGIRSGRMIREGFPAYGVIFTSSDAPGNELRSGANSGGIRRQCAIARR